jgi:hypothetical protein
MLALLPKVLRLAKKAPPPKVLRLAKKVPPPRLPRLAKKAPPPKVLLRLVKWSPATFRAPWANVWNSPLALPKLSS